MRSITIFRFYLILLFAIFAKSDISYSATGHQFDLGDIPADSIREPNAILFGANGIEYGPGGTYSFIKILNPDIKSLYLSSMRSVIIDSMRLWNGEVIQGATKDIVIEDSSLINYLLEINATVLIRRIPNTQPEAYDTIIDFSGSSGLAFIDLSEHYKVEFPIEADVDIVKSELSAVLPPSCYVQYASIPIDFGGVDPLPEYKCDSTVFWDQFTRDQWYLWPPDDTINGRGVDFWSGWRETCPFVANTNTIAILDNGFGNYYNFHPDFRPNIDFERSRVGNYLSYFHGLYVTGIVAAAAENYMAASSIDKPSDYIPTGIGIIGGAYMSNVILLDRTDSTSYIADLKYIIDSCPDVEVVNFSWGLIEIDDPGLLEIMIDGYIRNNISYVAAAGNCGGFEGCGFITFPAAYGQSDSDNLPEFEEFVTAVGHCKSDLKKVPSSSNHGDFIDIAAPGANILTTGPLTKFEPTEEEERGYSIHSGSSLSAPMVSASYSLMKMIRPNFASSTLFEIMMDNVFQPDDPDNQPEDWIPYFGNGILDVGEAAHDTKGLYCDTICGDIDGDCRVNVGDALYLLRSIAFMGPEPWVPENFVDVNGDCASNLNDVIYLIKYFWQDGPEPICGCGEERIMHPVNRIPKNYPNPFNSSTVIELDIPIETDYKVRIYNILGRKINEFKGKGEKGKIKISWDGTDQTGAALASGLYFYRIDAGDYSASNKMIILK